MPTLRAYDRSLGEVVELTAEQCASSYRESVFKRTLGRWVVLAVTFGLRLDDVSTPVGYAELARRLGVEVGERAAVFEAGIDDP